MQTKDAEAIPGPGVAFFSHMVLHRLSALGLAETAGGFRVCTGLPFMVAASGFPNSDTGTGTQTPETPKSSHPMTHNQSIL